jgi:hypothetical protein
MATKMCNLPLEIAHFRSFVEWLPRYKEMDPATIEILLEFGMLEVSTCYEHAIANYSGTTVISLDHADISCGSDAKLASARKNGRNGREYGANVSGIHNKTGDLLIQCYERSLDQMFWFRMPHKSYCYIPKSSNIDIPFYLDGSPRRVNDKRVNPWKYECGSFQEMCAE